MQEQRLIEQYLRGEMSAQQRNEFLNKVQSSPELSSELAFQEQLFKELGDEDKRHFTGQLTTIGADFFKGAPSATGTSSLPRWWFLPLLAVVVGAAMWYFWPAATSESTPALVAAPPPVTSEPATIVPSNDTAVAIAPTQTTPVTSKENEGNLKTDAAPATTDKGPAFAPNTHWEKLAAQRLTGSNAKQVKATGKIKNSREVALSLQFKWPAGENPGPMTVYFYSNSEEDRLTNKPVKQVDLNLLEQASGEDGAQLSAYSLDYSAGINWAPGLYYFVVVPKGSNEPIYVGRMKQ